MAMEGMKSKLFLKTLTIVLLISIVSGTTEEEDFHRRGRIPRPRRGIGRMVAQIFFGGRPAGDLNNAPSTYQPSYRSAPNYRRNHYQQPQSSRNQEYSSRDSEYYDQDQSEQGHSTWDDYYQNEGHHQQTTPLISGSDYNYQSSRPYEDHQSVLKSEPMMSANVRRPVVYTQPSSAILASPSNLGTNYLTNFVKGHDHFKENFERNHQYFKDSFIRANSALQHQFIKGQELVRNDFIRGNEILKHKVASYWSTFMPNAHSGRPSGYTEDYNRHPVFVDEFSR